MSGNDIFRILYAKSDDIFLTEHLLKLNFEQYLYWILKKEGYKQVYMFDTLNANMFRVTCETSKASSKYTSNMPVKFLVGKPQFTWNADQGKNHFETEQKLEDVSATIQKLIKSETEDRYAFVFPMDTFSAIYGDGSVQSTSWEFIEKNRCKNGSIFLLTGEVEDGRTEYKLPQLPGNSTGKITVWETFEHNQIMRLVQKVNLTGSGNLGWKDAEDKANMLCEQLTMIQNGRLFGKKVETRKDLYELLLKKEI